MADDTTAVPNLSVLELATEIRDACYSEAAASSYTQDASFATVTHT